jgi:rod shape-determining protein MreD
LQDNPLRPLNLPITRDGLTTHPASFLVFQSLSINIKNMKWIIFIITAYLAVVLQTTIVQILFPTFAKPWPLIILANIIILRGKNDPYVLPKTWMLGLLGDLSSTTPLGSLAISFALFTLIIQTVQPVLFAESPLAHAFTSAVGVIIILGCYAVINTITRNNLFLPYSIFEVLGQAVSTAFFAVIISKLFPAKHRPIFIRR